MNEVFAPSPVTLCKSIPILDAETLENKKC